jgi:phage shock protein A
MMDTKVLVSIEEFNQLVEAIQLNFQIVHDNMLEMQDNITQLQKKLDEVEKKATELRRIEVIQRR